MTRTPILTLLLCLMSATFVKAQEINQSKHDAKGKEMLVGKIDKKGLTRDPYATWFNVQHKKYRMDPQNINAIEGALKNHEITIFMGTWCGDSKREVPRFYKILEQLDFPMHQLTVVAVDYESDQYKKSPGGEERGLNILKVPTFIFYKKGKEVNRIVESPVVSLEGDMYKIVTDRPYAHNYSDLEPN